MLPTKRATMSMRIPHRLVQRVCVWFCVKLDLTAKDTLGHLRNFFPGICYSRSTVYRWHLAFAQGRQKLGDFMRQGAPISARTRRNIRRVKALVNQNRRINIDQISNSVGVSHGTVHKILHKDLKLCKKCPKFVPHKLTDAQKAKRLEFC